MEVEVLAIMIPIVGIISVVIMVIYLRKFENQERMEMIDKSLDPSVFARKHGHVSAALRTALLLIGAGIGLLLGYFLDRAFNMEEVGYFSMLLIVGGTGLGIAYLIEVKKQKG